MQTSPAYDTAAERAEQRERDIRILATRNYAEEVACPGALVYAVGNAVAYNSSVTKRCMQELSHALCSKSPDYTELGRAFAAMVSHHTMETALDDAAAEIDKNVSDPATRRHFAALGMDAEG